MSEASRKVRDAVLRVLSEESGPWSAEQLAKRVNAPVWEVQEAVWRLASSYQAEITKDWKIKRGSDVLQPA
jgi:hypothetical protein